MSPYWVEINAFYSFTFCGFVFHVLRKYLYSCRNFSQIIKGLRAHLGGLASYRLTLRVYSLNNSFLSFPPETGMDYGRKKIVTVAIGNSFVLFKGTKQNDTYISKDSRYLNVDI